MSGILVSKTEYANRSKDGHLFDNHDDRVRHLMKGGSLRVSPAAATHEQLVHLAKVAAQHKAYLTVVEANTLTPDELAAIAVAAKSAVSFVFA